MRVRDICWLGLRRCLLRDLPTPTANVLTVKETAERLGVSQRTIYDLIESGRLRAQRIGIGRGTIRIRPTDLNGCLAEPEPTTYKHLTI